LRREIADGEVGMPFLREYIKYMTCSTIMLVIIVSRGLALPFDVDEFVSNMKDRNDQTVLTGTIDSLIIIRPQVEFRMGPGRLAIFDFGETRPSAMVFEGKGRFLYMPPDEVERGQLVKFTKKESLDEEFDKIAFLFTIELDDFPDTSNFIREKAPKKVWNILATAMDDAFDHLRIHMPNKLIDGLLTEFPGFYLYADFDLRKYGRFAFIEDPTLSDQFSLHKRINLLAFNTFDYVGGYSNDKGLPSRRGIQAIDITNYKIESRIEGSGRMWTDCRIEFTPIRWGCAFLYFNWYHDNKNISAVDSNGDSLIVVHRKEESGFGLILNKPLEFGKSDHIDIRYECKGLLSVYGLFYIYGKTTWFPSNNIRDLATFELIYDIPESYQVVSCGKQLEFNKKSGRAVSRWIVDHPVEYVSFNLGVFESKEIIVENLPPVKVFMSEQIDHQAIALYRAYFGDLSAADMIGQVSADVTNSLAFFTSIFGPCPFDTVKATEIPFTGEGQGSPGLVHLTWSTFQADDMLGYSESFRAHEVAHQWWGHLIDKESYRDEWITEGLANYSGLWFYEMSSKNPTSVRKMLKYWTENILFGSQLHPVQKVWGDTVITVAGGGGRSFGGKAGPISIGYRLSSSKSDDYYINVYYKGAYTFHMIRYLLHDYNTGSDDAFAAFLKDIVDTFRGKVITTRGLQSLLEKHIGAEMGWFFDQWVYGTAIPEYKFSYNSEKTDDGNYAVVCHVKQEKVPDNFQMLVPITVLFEGDRYIHLRLLIDQPEADIDLALLPFEPQKIIFNTFDAVLCKVKYE
jgi:hypothetical protein